MTQKPTISQALPSARIIPQLTVSDELQNRLTEIASKAHCRSTGESDTEPTAVIMAPVRARTAAQFYVSEKEFETALPTFRNALRDGGLRKAINALRSGLESDTLPPFAQMRSLFCYGDPNSNGLEDGSAEQIKQRQEREDLWDAKFSAARLGEFLGQWQSLMDELHELTVRTKAPVTAQRTFVSTLASYWSGELRCNLYSARDGYEQTGAFASFVRAAAEIIPKTYRPRSWNHSIRSVIEAREKTSR